VSWTAGYGNGGSGNCKLQFLDGATWVDIQDATLLNCDGNLSPTAFALNDDGWKSSWGGTQVRIVRIGDLVAAGTFSETLACSPVGGSSTSTPVIDEDCDGSWDNSTTELSSNFSNVRTNDGQVLSDGHTNVLREWCQWNGWDDRNARLDPISGGPGSKCISMNTSTGNCTGFHGHHQFYWNGLQCSRNPLFF
jgi:hypothetical protein